MKQIGSAYSENKGGTSAKRNIFFDFSFQNSIMKLEEEFLIDDFVDMLSSIGGTLGMCIGFSFVGFVSFVLGHLQNFIGHLIRKKSNSEIGVMHNNVVKWKIDHTTLTKLKKTMKLRSQLNNSNLMERNSCWCVWNG